MKNKYYTPTKEEFHIGFEYEVKDYLDDQDKTMIDWIPFTIMDGEEIQDMIDETKHDSERFRVKYLDKDDIEDLGFIPSTNEKHLYYLGDVSLQLHNNNCLTIRYNNKFNNEWRTAVEFIVIKNKSELKVLLKQLNIL